MPVKLVPLTAEAMPEPSADFRTWTVRLKRGILFADDPAFKGQPRELVAADYVFSFKRIYDPALKSPSYSTLNDDGIVGLDAVRQRGVGGEGAVRLSRRGRGPARARPLHDPVQARRAAAALHDDAREPALTPRWRTRSCEAYGDDIMAHPVGTGPYRLKLWRRTSRIVLDKNPTFRDMRYRSRAGAGRCRRAGVGEALQRPSSAAQRWRRDRDRRGEPAALAQLPERRRRFRARAARALDHRRAERQDRAQPRAPGHHAAALHQSRRRALVLQHGGPCRRRLRAGAGRVATRREPVVRHRQGDPHHPARPGDPGAGADGARHLRLRPGAAHREQRARRRSRQRAARHLRLRRPQRRRLARAPRRLAARDHDAQPARADLSPVQRELAEQLRRRSACASSSRRRSSPRA